MTGDITNPEILKIPEAAKYLGVTQRWIYRRIWSGDLPASKVGGFYFIQRKDLDDLISSNRKEATLEVDLSLKIHSQIKCGLCFEEIEGPIDGLLSCKNQFCESIICSKCANLGNIFCARHDPEKGARYQQKVHELEKGMIPLLVTSGEACSAEQVFIGKLTERLNTITTIMHPLTKEIIRIQNPKNNLVFTDDSPMVMGLLNTIVLGTDLSDNLAFNKSAQLVIEGEKLLKQTTLVISGKFITRLANMLRDGFDTHPISREELIQWVLPPLNQVNNDKQIYFVIFASPTGWTDTAKLFVETLPIELSAFPLTLKPYLLDLIDHKLYFNQQDDITKRYSELFKDLYGEIGG